MNDIKIGTLAITYIFSDAVVTQNIEIESEMKKELQDLAENWKKRNFIRRYIIADDEIIDKSLIEQNHKQLNSGWIPVSDGLPKVHKRYLVSMKHKLLNETFIDCRYFYSDYQFEYRDDFERRTWEVIAWQPLPQPYKEEENE